MKNEQMTTHLRVIEGGKGRRKPPRIAAKLYRAYSVGNLSKDDKVYHDVRFNWYRLERKSPVAPYEELISDYESLDEWHRRCLEGDVNRYLTRKEIDALKVYLMEAYGLETFVEEISLPISEPSGFSDRKKTIVYDFLELSEEEGYSLPFKIWGYYTLVYCLTTPSLEKGVIFLRKSLEHMQIGSGIDQKELEEVVKALYSQDGLYVKKRDEREQGFS